MKRKQRQKKKIDHKLILMNLISLTSSKEIRVRTEKGTLLKKGYLRYKAITSQNVSSKAQIKKFFYFVEKLCSLLKIFKFLYF